MPRRHSDIPLRRDGSGRFLPWLIALMVYLSALSLAGLLLLQESLARWDRGLAGTMTVQVPPIGDDARNDGNLRVVLDILRGTAGVLSVSALDRIETGKLIEPWLGTSLTPEELQLPRLIDLRINPEARPDVAALRARLTAAVPGAVLDDHRQWLDRLVAVGLSIELAALAIVFLIGAAAVLTVIFTTRTGLAIHYSIVELLHLIGARDRYIARQFERQALRLGLRGGLAGLVLAILTLIGISHAAETTVLLGGKVRLLPSLHLALWHWLILALLPFVAALVAMVTARLTVLRALARMP